MPEAQTACDRREALSRRLEARGWCFGEGAEFGYQAAWAECRGQTTRNRLSFAEQKEADSLAVAYARNRRIQAEAERQLEETEQAQVQRDLEALRRIP